MTEPMTDPATTESDIAQDVQALVRIAGTPGRDSFVWAAGERAAITALRAHLATLDHPRERTDLSNYWTLGQAAQD